MSLEFERPSWGWQYNKKKNKWYSMIECFQSIDEKRVYYVENKERLDIERKERISKLRKDKYKNKELYREERKNDSYREECKKKMMEWRENRSEKKIQEMKEKEAEKIICECGRKVGKYRLNRHKESNIHEKRMKLKNKKKLIIIESKK